MTSDGRKGSCASCGWVQDRCEFRDPLRDGGCIDRRSREMAGGAKVSNTSADNGTVQTWVAVNRL